LAETVAAAKFKIKLIGEFCDEVPFNIALEALLILFKSNPI